jgi:hypothetical protein
MVLPLLLLPLLPPPQPTTTTIATAAAAIINIMSSHYPQVESRNKSINDTKLLSHCYFTYVWNPVYIL